MSSVGHVNGVKVSRESTSKAMGALPARDVGTDDFSIVESESICLQFPSWSVRPCGTAVEQVGRKADSHSSFDPPSDR